jgi:hypothetical protein
MQRIERCAATATEVRAAERGQAGGTLPVGPARAQLPAGDQEAREAGEAPPVRPRGGQFLRGFFGSGN